MNVTSEFGRGSGGCPPEKHSLNTTQEAGR
ncbi:hypothetical protein GA0115233_110112 [Streptomyces sp. DI166]|nr:hypothetical protein GA0115233_110111 [Streptomyces sp. DI166]SBT94745.1 hypothetical protein GA0115233_110112 [Streptomyces sp. DI166]